MIIDPSGQATEFIMNEYKDRKITRTSFLDDAFRKNLESALRFGNPLLVQVCVCLNLSLLPGTSLSVVDVKEMSNDTTQTPVVFEHGLILKNKALRLCFKNTSLQLGIVVHHV